MKYVFHPQALTEYSEAVQYYAQGRTELAQALIDAVEDAIYRITVQVVNAGLSDPEGEATFFLSANSELNSLQQSSSQQLQETMQLLTLDGELGKRGWQVIDFIKLDAEGEEAKILAGGHRFFTEQSPLIMFEFAHGNQSNLALIQLFQDLGYAIYRFVPVIGCLAPVDVSQPIPCYQFNLFACKADRAPILLG